MLHRISHYFGKFCHSISCSSLYVRFAIEANLFRSLTHWSHYIVCQFFILHCFSYFSFFSPLFFGLFCAQTFLLQRLCIRMMKWKSLMQNSQLTHTLTLTQTQTKCSAFIMQALKINESRWVMKCQRAHTEHHNWNSNIAFRNYSIDYARFEFVQRVPSDV